MTETCITPGALRTTSVVRTGGRAFPCLRPVLRESTVGKQRTSPPTRLFLETCSTGTTTTLKRAPLDRSSRPHSGKHTHSMWGGARWTLFCHLSVSRKTVWQVLSVWLPQCWYPEQNCLTHHSPTTLNMRRPNRGFVNYIFYAGWEKRIKRCKF